VVIAKLFRIRLAVSASLIFLLNAIACGAVSAAEKIELPEEAVSKKVLENGLIILAKDSGPKGLVSLNLKIRAGSRLEGEYLGSGISHLVEHMVFKGTKTRRVGDIEKEIKSYGGFLNASTSKDLTEYHVSVSSEYLSEAISLLKDMMMNSVFDIRELENEKEVILKEIKLNEDEPESRIIKLLNETAYLEHPYRYPTIGYEETFKRLTRKDVVKFYNRMYVPNRMVISMVGAVDASKAIAIAEAEFKDFKLPDYGPFGSGDFEPTQLTTRTAEAEMDINLSYLTMGFHSTSLLDYDLFAMDILANILGRGDNSRLNTVLFKNRALVHLISCWNHTPQEPGLFTILALTDREKMDGTEKAILEEIAKIKEMPVGDDELRAAKRMVLSDYLYARQTQEAVASDISLSQILTGDHEFSNRYVTAVQRVSKEDINNVATKYLTDKNLTVVRLAPRSSKTAKDKTCASLAAQEQSEDALKDIIKKETFPNGLRVLLREDTKTPTVAITVAILGGLMIEDKMTNGISSLTGEMLLKGTQSKNESQIKGYIESLGGNISAFSGFNGFGLNVTVLKPDIVTALGILQGILTDSTFPEDEIDKTKTRMLAMLKNDDDDIFQRGFNELRRQLFPDSPYGLRIGGEEESLKSLTRDDLMRFYKSYLVPANMVIAVSGDIDNSSVLTMLKDLFGSLNAATQEMPEYKGGKIKKVNLTDLEMEKEQSLILMGFETTDIKNMDRYALDVLGSVLSGHSGRLFNKLRDKLSLAYTLGAAQKLMLDTGYLVFYIATTEEKIEAAKKALIGEIREICRKLPSDGEIILAKKELMTNHRLKLQTNLFYSFASALDELYGLGYDNLYKYEAEIKKVTKEDVKRVARKYLNLNLYAQVIVTPKPKHSE